MAKTSYPLDKSARAYWKQQKRVQEIKKAFFDGEIKAEDAIGSLCLERYSAKVAGDIVTRWDEDVRAGKEYVAPIDL